MMNLDRCSQIYDIVAYNHGIRMYQIAARLGVNRYTAWRSILTMEFQGFLLAEDDSGGLYAVCIDKPRRDSSTCRQTISKRKDHDERVARVANRG